MKVTPERVKQIIAEERIRAIVENKLPWSKADFFYLLNEARWFEKLDPESTAYKIAMAAGEQWDIAQKAARKPLAMTKDHYMKLALHQNANAPHKFSRWQEYEKFNRIPEDDPDRSAEEIIMKGYPGEGLVPRKTTPDMKLQQMLSKDDRAQDIDFEIEAWISPFGYIHAKVPSYEMRRTRFGGRHIWVYTGDYFPNVKTGKPEKMGYEKRRGSWGYPEVTTQSLRLEKTAPSPDAKGMSGKDTQGHVDVQDPTMEEQLIDAIREEIAALREE